jgi:hypothetical protein
MPTTSAGSEPQFLTSRELADRWRHAIKPSTLVNWRVQKKGPRWVKVGPRVLYPIDAVVEYERSSFNR